jgi:thiamine-phosphate pyrophosphorylase
MQFAGGDQFGERGRPHCALSRRFDARQDEAEILCDGFFGKAHGMSDSLSRRRLARAAARLAVHRPFTVPPLVLMTDDERLADPLAAARALPRGSMVVVRVRDGGRRKALAFAMMKVARGRGLIVLIASDGKLAAACGADGVHLPEAVMGRAARERACHAFFLITASVHSFAAVGRATGIDALFLSPIFPTQSHPGRAALTAVRANFIARAARVPVYALGGIDPQSAALLSPASFCGIAAVGALDVQS